MAPTFLQKIKGRKEKTCAQNYNDIANWQCFAGKAGIVGEEKYFTEKIEKAQADENIKNY